MLTRVGCILAITLSSVVTVVMTLCSPLTVPLCTLSHPHMLSKMGGKCKYCNSWLVPAVTLTGSIVAITCSRSAFAATEWRGVIGIEPINLGATVYSGSFNTRNLKQVRCAMSIGKWNGRVSKLSVLVLYPGLIVEETFQFNRFVILCCQKHFFCTVDTGNVVLLWKASAAHHQ